jgi:hypothetical protein
MASAVAPNVIPNIENRKVSFGENIIHEGINRNKVKSNAICTNDEQVENISKQVNEKDISYRDTLVRSNEILITIVI